MNKKIIAILHELWHGSCGERAINGNYDVISSEQDQISLLDESDFDNTNLNGDEGDLKRNNAEKSQKPCIF